MAHLRPGGSSSAPAVVAASSATLAIRQKAYAELLQAMVVRSFAACSRPAVAAAQAHFRSTKPIAGPPERGRTRSPAPCYTPTARKRRVFRNRRANAGTASPMRTAGHVPAID
jgi:hypothetical protein